MQLKCVCLGNKFSMDPVSRAHKNSIAPERFTWRETGSLYLAFLLPFWLSWSFIRPSYSRFAVLLLHRFASLPRESSFGLVLLRESFSKRSTRTTTKCLQKQVLERQKMLSQNFVESPLWQSNTWQHEQTQTNVVSSVFSPFCFQKNSHFTLGNHKFLWMWYSCFFRTRISTRDYLNGREMLNGSQSQRGISVSKIQTGMQVIAELFIALQAGFLLLFGLLSLTLSDEGLRESNLLEFQLQKFHLQYAKQITKFIMKLQHQVEWHKRIPLNLCSKNNQCVHFTIDAKTWMLNATNFWKGHWQTFQLFCLQAEIWAHICWS